MGTFEENLYFFAKEIEKFEYRVESLDHIWDILFPDQKSFASSFRDDGRTNPGSIWNNLILDALKWPKIVNKNWILANLKVQAFDNKMTTPQCLAHLLICQVFLL